jgi:hypothetical protein
MAEWFPEQLVSRPPAKRRTQDNEDPRMDIFDAVGLAVVFHISQFTAKLV